MAGSRTAEAYENLRTRIVNTRYLPNEKLKIEVLSSDLGVSPGAVREALSRLTSEGLVIARPQRGFIVAPVSGEELRDLTEVRVQVETTCLARSIELGDAAWERRVRESCARLLQVPMVSDAEHKTVNPEWTVPHKEFHEALVCACDSRWWLRIRDQLFAQTERYRQLSAPFAQEKRDTATEHREIMEATVARNIPLATALIREHFSKTTNIVLSSQAVPKNGVHPDAFEPA